MTEQEIITRINQDRYGREKRRARKGAAYYDGRHDILDYRIYFIDGDGRLQEDAIRTNSRVSHPFFTELVDQEVQYLLSGGIRVEAEDPQLEEWLKEYFGEGFLASISELLEGAIAKGWDYLVAYKDENDRTAFAYMDSLGVIEIRNEKQDTVPDEFIYYYPVKTEQEYPALKIEYWDAEQTTYYIYQNGHIELDRNEPINPRPHILYRTENGYERGSFGYLPLFRLDNNRKRRSGLFPVKALIDDYDLMDCGLSNNIQDTAEGIYVVKGYKGGKTLDEITFNLKQKKQIGVSEKGDVDIKTINIPVEARKTKAEMDEKNIYRFGMGFNSAQIGDGNVTNIVIKSRYFLLDLKCNKLEIRLQRFLKSLLKVVLREINERYHTDYRTSDVRFVLDREVMTNAQDNATIDKTEAERRQIEVNTILSLQEQLGDETVVRMLCEVLDLDYDTIRNQQPETEVPLAYVDTEQTKAEEKSAVELAKLNGAQITSLMNILNMVKQGTIGRTEAISIIVATLGISKETAETFIANNEVAIV